MKFKPLLGSLICSLALTGCSWQIPESISVKSQAEYNFSMGNFTQSFNSDFGTDAVFKSMGVENARVFDYFPGKKDQKLRQFYLRIPLLEIPVDFSSYFKNSGISESVENMSFSKDIVIPTVNFIDIENIDMGAVSRRLNEGLTVSGYAQNGGLSFSLEFSKITYSRGNMIITCAGMPDGATVSLSNGSSNRSGTFNSNVAVINLASFTFYKDGTTITFSNPSDLAYVGVIEDSSVISQAEGVTVGDAISVPVTLTINSISTDSSFDYCIVKNGMLYTEIELPPDWSNIDLSYEISSSGGMDIASPLTEGGEKEINLEGKKITSEPASINAVVYLTLDNASFSSKIDPVFTAYSEIENFRKIALDTSDVSTKMSVSEKMSEVMLSTVKSIKLSSSGLSGTYVNTLPQGNDIEVVASSGFLGLNNGKDIMTSQNEDGKLRIMTPATFEKDIVISKDPKKENEYNSWDFQMDIHFPGYTEENPNRIEINEVAPGEKYSIKLELSTETNWKQIVIDSSDINQKEVTELGFNMNSIFSSFGDNLGFNLAEQAKIDSVPVYLYCTKPSVVQGKSDPFASTSFFGSINMFCGKKDGSSIEVAKDNDGNALESEFCKESAIPYVNVPNVEISENSIITDISNFNYSKRQDIASLVNQTTEETDLYLDFDVSFSNSATEKTVTIVPEMLDKSVSSPSIGIIAVVIVPLRFKVVNDDININIMKMMGIEGDSDLFGRSSASSETAITQFQNVIRSVSIKYEERALPFYANPEINLLLDMKFSDEPKKYSLESGEIAVYAGEIERMMSVYPLVPEVTCSIKKDSKFTIPRNVELSMNLKLQLVTDGSITLFGDN